MDAWYTQSEMHIQLEGGCDYGLESKEYKNIQLFAHLCQVLSGKDKWLGHLVKDSIKTFKYTFISSKINYVVKIGWRRQGAVGNRKWIWGGWFTTVLAHKGGCRCTGRNGPTKSACRGCRFFWRTGKGDRGNTFLKYKELPCLSLQPYF